MTDAAAPFLPYGRHTIDEDDIAAVVAVLRSDSLTGGAGVSRFETAFAKRCGTDEAVACANGTAALHLAALAADIGPGDQVVVPAVTFLATASAPHLAGADVVFADVDPDTGLMTAETFETALAQARGPVKAAFPVHLNGGCVDMAALAPIAEARGLSLIEDACHAIGATIHGDGPVGSCARSIMATFSLHPVKTIAMGEGGLITTNDRRLADRLRLLRNHGMTRDASAFDNANEAFDEDGAAHAWYYEMPFPGFNYRASEIHCALGESQLAKLDRFVARRRALADLYDTALAPLAPVLRPAPRAPTSDGGWHLYPVLVDFTALQTTRDRVMKALRAEGVGTQVHYLPVHRQAYWRARQPDATLPGADAYYARCLSLPLFPAMTAGDIDRVATVLGRIVGCGA